MNLDKEQIKELILTDYLDGRMDAAAQEQLESVIQQHPDLQKFVRQARQGLAEPFATLSKEQPPEQVWSQLQQRLAAEQPRPAIAADWESEKPGFWEWWIELRSFTRLALSGAGLALSVFLVAIVSQWATPVTPMANNESEQIEYLMLLVQGDPLPELDGEDEGLGTTIENYFL